MNQPSDDQLSYTDEELVVKSLEDKVFFAYLIDRYEEKITRYIKRLGAFSKEDIEDLLQNIFIKVYQNLNGFETTLKFSSWLYRIAHNETISFFRRNKVRPQGNSVDVSPEVWDTFSSDTNIIEGIDRIYNADSLRLSLSHLEEKYRNILILRFFEGKSYDEISDILTIPPGTVAVRINRAKKKVKTYLEDSGYEHGT